jgi:CRISP-associated protein Cas1
MVDNVQTLEPTPVPARMLNEFIYCPRLFYLEWVQGEFADSVDTVDGRYRHSRVDQDHGDLADPTESPDETTTIHARSVHLTSEALGLTARLDLVEQEGGEVAPVDYKRGKTPAIAGRAWETDQIQLCAQGLLLMEQGFVCTHGIVYYVASRERVAVPFTTDLMARTITALNTARDLAEHGPIPPPLVDSPKCVRCSLAAICLPDEVNALAGRHADTHTDVRRLLPARDDALAVYVQEQGASVGKSGDVLEVRQRGEVLQKVRVADCSQVSLFGGVQISAQALYALSARGIPVCHFSTGGWFHSMTAGFPGKNIDLRRQQYAAASDPGQALKLARAVVGGKIRNARTLLRRNLPELPEPAKDELQRLAEMAELAPPMATLLGLEGAAGRLYFRHFGALLKHESWPRSFDFAGRNRRPPADPVNAMLSFVYALLVKDVSVTALAVGFDPYMGFYHQPHFGRPALALDLAEEFRPLIGDSVVIGMVNTGEVTAGDFVFRVGACALNATGRKKVMQAYERRMGSEVRHPTFGYTVSYRRTMEIQARLLGRALTGELPAYVPFRTR